MGASLLPVLSYFWTVDDRGCRCHGVPGNLSRVILLYINRGGLIFCCGGWVGVRGMPPRPHVNSS